MFANKHKVYMKDKAMNIRDEGKIEVQIRNLKLCLPYTQNLVYCKIMGPILL